MPIVAMDFCFITAAPQGVIAAHAVMSKKATPELVSLLAKDINNMVHARVLIKVDKEPGMRALAGSVKNLRSHPKVVERNLRCSGLISPTGWRRGASRR